MESAASGLLIFVGMFWAAATGGTTYAVAIGAVIGTLISTATARLLKIERTPLLRGLYGFNGMLVGIALPTFLENSPALWPLLVIAAVASTFVTLALARLLRTVRISGLTFPFIFTSWLSLLLVSAARETGIFPAHLPTDTVLTGQLSGLADILHASLTSISQVYLIDSPGAGFLFLLALLIHSRWAAGLAALGAILSMFVAWALGADEAMIYNGLWGYSAVLTMPAIGCIFLKPGPRVFVYSVTAGLASVLMQAVVLEMSEATGLPALTFAFVLTTWLFLLMQQAFRPKIRSKAG